MSRPAVSVVASLAMNLIMLRAYCRILHLRSKRGFALFFLAVTALNLYLFRLSEHIFLHAARTYVLNPCALIVVPLLLSVGPLHVRITRISFIVMLGMASESLCAVAFMLMGHQSTPAALADPANLGAVALTYAIGMFTFAVGSELFIGACERQDSAISKAFRWPLIVYLVVSLAFLWRSSLQATYYVGGTAGPLISLICITYSAVCAFVLLDVAQHDAQLERERAEREIRNQQQDYVIHEVHELKARARLMGQLRHDLANQVQVVAELAASGRQAEAARYLDALSDQARRLAVDDDA